VTNPQGTFWHCRGRLPDFFLTANGGTPNTVTPGLTIRDSGGTIRYFTLGQVILPGSASPNFT